MTEKLVTQTQPQLLRNYTANIPLEYEIFQPLPIYEELHKKLDLAFKDYRLAKLDLSKFKDLDTTIVAIILDKDNLQLQALANSLSIVSCMARPSIKYQILTKKVTTKNVILILIKLIENLILFFGKNEIGVLEELAWQIFNSHQDFSIEDFVKFFDLCKQKEFATEFQYITSRGINTEFVIDWLKKYRIMRKKEYSKFKSVEANNKKETSSLETKVTLKNEEDYKKIFDKAAIIRNLKGLKEIEIDYIIKTNIDYQLQYFNSTTIEKRTAAIRHIDRLRQLYKEEYISFPDEKPVGKLNEKGKLERTNDLFVKTTNAKGEEQILRASSITVQEYINFKMKNYCNQYKEEYSLKAFILETYDLLDEIFKKIVYSSGEELLCEIAPEMDKRGCFPYSASAAKLSLVKFLINKYKREYTSYWIRQIEEEKLPVCITEFVISELWKWSCTKYFSLHN